jgi:hypothetical protein
VAGIMAASRFFEALRAGTVPVGAECHVPVATAEGGRPITLPVKLLRRPGGSLRERPLLVVFHGAVDQEKRGFPYHEGGYALEALAGTDAIVLSVSDPSLWLSTELRAAWYSANRYGDMPQAIHEFILAVSEILEPRRLIFAGSSTGAHAALIQSARFEGCVCVVCNPIARISGYYARAVERYLAICWGPEAAVRPRGGEYALPAGVLDDCGTIYGEGHGHSLIVVQNATDPHLLRQAVPFIARIRNPERLLFLSAFFPGSIGHVVPRVAMASWLRAATRARTTDCLDIAGAHGEAQAEAAGTADGFAASGIPEDLDLAARIAAAVLRK